MFTYVYRYFTLVHMYTLSLYWIVYKSEYKEKVQLCRPVQEVTDFFFANHSINRTQTIENTCFNLREDVNILSCSTMPIALSTSIQFRVRVDKDEWYFMVAS